MEKKNPNIYQRALDIVNNRINPDIPQGDEEYALKEDLGELSDLETEDKSNLVAAINEAANRGGFVAQTEAPSDTNVLWIDIDDDSGGGGGSAYIAMRVSGGYIQYTTDNVTWVNLIAVADLKGAKGDKGDKGDTGAQGAQGIQGEQGIQGIQGIQGVKGDKGDKGDAYTLTNADKQTIVTAVVDALPKYNGGVT